MTREEKIAAIQEMEALLAEKESRKEKASSEQDVMGPPEPEESIESETPMRFKHTVSEDNSELKALQKGLL